MLTLAHFCTHGLTYDFLATAATERVDLEFMLHWFLLVCGICVLGVRAHRLSKKEKIAPPASWFIPLAAVAGVLWGIAGLLGWMK